MKGRVREAGREGFKLWLVLEADRLFSYRL
jgi:hypothetical protein